MMTESLRQALKSREVWLAMLGGQDCYFCAMGDAEAARLRGAP